MSRFIDNRSNLNASIKTDFDMDIKSNNKTSNLVYRIVFSDEKETHSFFSGIRMDGQIITTRDKTSNLIECFSTIEEATYCAKSLENYTRFFSKKYIISVEAFTKSIIKRGF